MDLTGSASLDTDPNHLNGADYNLERTTFQAGLSVEIPLERYAERNAYVAAIIGKQQAARALDLQEDTIRLEVQRAIRRIARARASLEIQQQNVEVNALRAQIARTEYRLGTLASNRDVVEAENDLRDARNDHAAALADYRRAILEFLRDTSTLRVNHQGRWVAYEPDTGLPVAPTPDPTSPANTPPPTPSPTAPGGP